LGNDSIQFVSAKYDALIDADAMILITEWKEFRSPDFCEMEMRMKNKIIFDGRNQYKESLMCANGFEYYQIGKSVNY
jgi:UDPglucose 6-dehydrogenase